jgi:hypothetical protein
MLGAIKRGQGNIGTVHDSYAANVWLTKIFQGKDQKAVA